MRKESPTYLDLQIATKTSLQTSSQRQEDVAYFAKVIKHYRHKEILVIPFNMDNHWVALLIFTKYE
jgi:hypothetical protein